MHIEPGVVDGAKIILSYATAAGAFGLAARMARQTIRQAGGTAALALRSVATTALVFSFFELLPHYPVGVSEVHLILGRSEERRVGYECVSTFSSRGSPFHSIKKTYSSYHYLLLISFI